MREREKEREGKEGTGEQEEREQTLGDTGENWSTTHSANWQLGGEILHLSFIFCTVVFPGNQIALIDEGK